MWKIGHKATAIDDAFLIDLRTGKVEAQVLKKMKEYNVQDVIRFKCMHFLDVGVSSNKKRNVGYQCDKCNEFHVVNKGEGSNIFFPETWFVKADEEKLFDRMKRKIKGSFENEEKHLYTYPVEEPKKKRVPKRQKPLKPEY